jgi:predicted permease
MSADRRPPAPPRWADALLEWALLGGRTGLSIIADLHQEFADVTARGSRRFPRLWYGREALALAVRYGVRRLHPGAGRNHQDERGEEYVSTFWSDLRFGFRMLAKTPGLSLIAVLTIALGVGFTTHTYSTVYGSVIRGLPVPGHDRLVSLRQSVEIRGIEDSTIPLHDYLDLRREQAVFDDLAAGHVGTINLAGDEGPPERYQGAFLSANALSLVGVPPHLGRVFREGEDAPDAPPLLVLSYHVWQNRFAGDAAIVGKGVRVNGQAAEIIGVMPEGFRFPFREDLWATHRQDPATLARRDGSYMEVFGRLKPGVTMETAAADLDRIAALLERRHPEDNEGVAFNLGPYAERYMPAQITAVMFLMLAATFGVLLIACANVANLLLARAAIRSREVAIRTAMGASRSRVIRQLLAEALVLATVGGALGLALAWVGVDVFNARIQDIQRPYWLDIRVDTPALLFALGVTLLATVVAGTVPAIRASGVRIGEILKDEGRGSSSFRLGRFSTALVVGEIAVSCGLLVAAGFMIQSVVNLRTMDMGFDVEGVLTGRVGLFEADYPERADRDRFFQTFEERLEAESGVTSVALATSLPALGGSRWVIAVEGESYPSDRDYPVTNGAAVTAGFFETLEVPILQGRDFTPSEAWSMGDPVVVVNESFVREVLKGREPLGTRVRLGREGSQFPWMRIVGVVPDLHVGGGVGGIGDDQLDPEYLYIPPAVVDVRFMSAVLASQGPPTALARRLREVVTALDANLPVYNLGTLEDGIREATWAFGLFGSLFTLFGIAALFMAAVGLYGVMAFSVAQRRQEMGVRMALGAGPSDIVGMVMRRGGVQLAIGIALGVGLGYGMGLPLSAVTYEVNLADPVLYAAIVATLGLAGLTACLVPARAATRTDPVEAMRP